MNLFQIAILFAASILLIASAGFAIAKLTIADYDRIEERKREVAAFRWGVLMNYGPEVLDHMADAETMVNSDEPLTAEYWLNGTY